MNARTRLLAAFGVGAGLMAVAGGAATYVNAHGGDAPKVHACSKTLAPIPGPRGSAPQPNANPNVRIMGAREACAAGELALDWSSAGGATGYERKSDAATILSGQTGGVALNCGTKKVLSAGCQLFSADISVRTSYARADNEWYFQFHNAGAAPVTVTIFAVCTTATS